MSKYFYVIFMVAISWMLLASPAWSTSYDPTIVPGQSFFDPGGNFLPTPVSGVYLNHGGKGDALFSEAYRAVETDEGFVTFFSIQNTTDDWLAAHVRLRSGRYSIEVIDFPVLLSPRDVAWFQFGTESDTNGTLTGVYLKTWDSETAEYSGFGSPNNTDWTQEGGAWSADLSDHLLLQFDQLKDVDGENYTSVRELTQGYIEVFGLFRHSNPFDQNFFELMGALASADPANDDVWGNPGIVEDPTGANPVVHNAMDVGKDLQGQVFMGDFTSGVYSGTRMRALANFRINVNATANSTAVNPPQFWYRDHWRANSNPPAFLQPEQTINRGTGTIIYNYHNDPAYSNPDWATHFGPTWNDGADYWGALGYGGGINAFQNQNPMIGVHPLDASWSVDEVDDALLKRQISSSYFNGGFDTTETFSLTAVTAITKYLHHFFNARSGLVASNSATPFLWTNSWPVGIQYESFAQNMRRSLDVEGLIGKLTVGLSYWDTEEFGPTLGNSPQYSTSLPYEVNLIPLGEESHAALIDFCFLVHDDDISSVFQFDSDVYPWGWFMLSGFELFGNQGGDPRNADPNFASPFQVGESWYNRSVPNSLLATYWPTLENIIGVSSFMMDWEFIVTEENETGLPNLRSFDPSWTNVNIGIGPFSND